MLPSLIACIGLVSLLVAPVSSQASLGATTDAGNGVHVPGQIPANSYEPLQHRLAFAGPGGMTVSWSSFVQLGNPQVAYGTRPDQLTQTVGGGSSTTYPTSRTYNNHVTLTGLQPYTKYYYQVSYTNCAYCAYTPTYSFTTARAAGDMTPFSMAAFGDLGLMGHDGLSTSVGPLGTAMGTLGANETNTIQSLLALKDTYEFIGHFGDIGYADYFLKASTQGYYGVDTADTEPSMQTVADRYESLSEQFFDQMQPITAERPWMVSPGNHEANCDNGGITDAIHKITYTDSYCLIGQTNFTFYIEHFRMPGQESGGNNNFWYSYDYGMVHFISLDTETDLGHGLMGPIQNVSNNHNGPFGLMNQQVNWLKNDLASVDRSKTPWVIVSLHRPWYTSVSPPTYPAWQQAFEQLMYEYQVDLYMQGHVHVYERMQPIYNGTVDANGLNNPKFPWVIVAGAAGHYDGLDTFNKVRQNYSAAGTDSVYGWGRLNFHNRTHLTYEYVASRNGSVIDSATLYKAHNPQTKQKANSRQ